MQVARPHLTVLLNALYDTETTTVPVEHPSDSIGELCRIELGAPMESHIEVTADAETYADRRNEVDREWGAPAVDELPEPRSYVNAYVASGLVAPTNQDDITEFLDRYGSPDLSAGHRPAVAGFDTNLLPWRIADILELSPGPDAVINGFALATGVRDELDWEYKRENTRPLEEAFGSEFERIWNQPAGANREGRLGETYYRRLRDHRYADEISSETGDEAIIESYDGYQQDNQKDVLLFSDDRDFVERARSRRILAKRVELPTSLPDDLTGSWPAIRDLLFMLTLLFGVITLPKVTLYGVWRGKGGQEWHDERIEIDARSPKIGPRIERDQAIIEQYDQLQNG